MTVWALLRKLLRHVLRGRGRDEVFLCVYALPGRDRPPGPSTRGRPAAPRSRAHRRLSLPVLLPGGGAGVTGPVVKLPDFSGEYDLARLNQAMDVVLEAGSEASGRYALVHRHGWPAVEAVGYTQAAQHCFDNSVDPNQLPPEVIHTTPERLLAALDAAVGTGEEPEGLCDDTAKHRPHLHDVPGGERIWCTADRAAGGEP